MRALIAGGLAAVVMPILVAGCGDSSESGDDNPAPAAATEAVTTHSAAPGSEDDPLALGQTAEIGHFDADDIGASEPISTLDVSVDEVLPASAADLKAGGLQLDEEQQASDVYYVRSTYTNTGDVPVENPATPGLETDAGRVPALIVIETGGGYADCPGAPERLAPGASKPGCSIVLLPSGAEFSTVSLYTGGDPLFVHWDAGA